MAFEVTMPQLGESIVEGTLIRWLKAVGDAVTQDEPVFEVTTDKVDAEIPSPASGQLLAIFAEVGQKVTVNQVVALIGQPGEGQAPTPEAAVSAPEVIREATPERGPEARLRVSPVVRRMAVEHGLDLAAIPGTGDGGRISRRDVEAYLANRAAEPAPRPAPPEAPLIPQDRAKLAAEVRPAEARPAEIRPVALGLRPPVPLQEGDRVEPMSPMRRTISDRMIESRQLSAHVHTCFEVDFSRVEQLRLAHKAAFEAQGVKLTYTAFIAQAVVRALRAFPILNAAHDGAQIVYRKAINLGIAVALDQGLIVPVIRDADELSLLGLSRQIADLAARARARKLKPDEVAGLTFSLTNPGLFGAQWGTPILPQPTTGILGVGTLEKRPRVLTLPDGTDTLGIRLCGYLTLGFDHRLVDGATGDQFMAHIKRTLETFELAL